MIDEVCKCIYLDLIKINILLEKGIFIDVFLSTITMKAFLIEIYGKTWSNGKFLSLQHSDNYWINSSGFA